MSIYSPPCDYRSEGGFSAEKEASLKYLCLAYGDEKRYAALSKTELTEMGVQCKSHDEELHQGGHLALIASLSPTRSTTTLRPVNGKTEVYDGPFAETKEQVGGFFILEARDLNEAIQAASKHPAARAGEMMGCALEIRPIEFFEASSALTAFSAIAKA